MQTVKMPETKIFRIKAYKLSSSGKYLVNHPNIQNTSFRFSTA